jgi:predicted nucleic acid-binding protein
MTGALVLDTGGWLKAIAGHREYEKALVAARPAIVPGLVLAELDWFLRQRVHRPTIHRLLSELETGDYQYEPPTAQDLARAMEIDAKFSPVKGQQIGLVDGTVAALAERLGVHRVLTTDSHYLALRVGKRWDISFELPVPPPHPKRHQQ